MEGALPAHRPREPKHSLWGLHGDQQLFTQEAQLGQKRKVQGLRNSSSNCPACLPSCPDEEGDLAAAYSPCAVATLCHTQGVVHVVQDFGHPRAEETAGLQQRHKGLLRVVKQKCRHQFQKAAPVYRHGERSGGSTNVFSGCRARKSVVRPVTEAANPPSQVGKTTVSNFQNKGFPTKAVRKDNHSTVHRGCSFS